MKVFQTITGGFSEALAEGAVMIPNLMLVGLYYQHYGEYDFILPFVILYAFEKAGTFLLSGLGRLKNPYLVWLSGNIIAIAGTVLLLFGNSENGLWDLGAVFIGLGLSCFSPVYRTVRDELKEKKAWFFTLSLYAGYLILGGYLVFVMLLRTSSMIAVFISVLLLVLVSTMQCVFLWKINPYRGEPLVERKTVRWEQFAYAFVVLAFTFAVRFYKQTAAVWMITWVAFGMLLLILLTVCIKHERYRIHSFRTLWYGAERNFVTIFSLIYFMAISKYDHVMIAYIMIGLGVTLSKLVTPLFEKKINANIFEPVCIIAANAASCLMLVPNTVCYMAGVLITVIFVSTGNSKSLEAYLNDERFVQTERRLVRSRFYGLGAVIEQAFMMIALFVFSLKILGGGTDALSAYAFRSGSVENQPAYFFTLLLCILFNTIWGLLYCKKRVFRREYEK